MFEAKPGTLFAERYEVIRLIGKGTMGWVLQVRDLDLEKDIVALKVLYPHLVDDEDRYQQLRNEVLISRQLSHPNILRTYDLDCNSTLEYFISMEYIDGWNLKELKKVAGNELTFNLKLRILRDIAQGLAFAHKRGVVHRCLKPENVLIGRDGQIKLVDFSIARSLEGVSGLTRTGASIGSPLYFSPEQFRGDEIDCQTDVYSFGVLAYELIAEKPPFETDDYFELAKFHLSEPFPRLSEDTDVPEWLDSLVRTCTEKEPQHRFDSATDLWESLQAQERAESFGEGPFVFRSLKREKRMNFVIGYAFLTALLFLAFVLAYASVVQTKNRVKIASSILRLEQKLSYDFPGLKSLLDTKASLRDPKSLEKAIARSAKQDVQTLALANFDTSLTNDQGLSAYHLLASDHWPFARKVLLAKQPNVDRQTHSGKTALMYAIERASLAAVLDYLKLSKFPNIRDNAGDAAIHYAVRQENPSILLALVPRLNIEQRDSLGNAPLHLSVYKDDIESLEILLNAEANVDVRDSLGRTPLMVALSKKLSNKRTQAIVERLIQAKASVSVRDNTGADVRAYAEKNPNPALRLLVEAYVDQ